MADSKAAIVLGGAGDVGEGIVRQLRKSGWRVIVPSRSAEKLDALERASSGPGELICIEADITNKDDIRSLTRMLSERQVSPDLVVASIGGWWSGPPLLDMDEEDWQRILEGSLTSHFKAARVFLPLIADKRDSQYVFINGGAARMPVPGSGPISVAAAAQEMMQRVFAAENAGFTSIYSLVLLSLIRTRSREVAPHDALSADDVGRAIIALYEDSPKNGASVDIGSPSDVASLK